MLEIRLKKSSIPQVSHLGIRIQSDFVVNVDIVFPKIVDKQSTKVSCIGNVGNFLHDFRQGNINQVSNPRESNVLETLVYSQYSQSFSVGPSLAIRYAQ